MDKNLRKWESLIKSYAETEELTAKASREIVVELSVKASITSLIREILSNRGWLQKIANRSYTHNNGFDKFVLLSSEKPPFKLRLHIWWNDGSLVCKENIHDHSWDFCSALVSGTMRFQIFQPDDAGTDFFHYDCGFPKTIRTGQEIRMSDSGYKFNFLGKAKLTCVFDTNLSTGNAYFLSHDLLHRVMKTPGATTSTIMLHGKFLRKNSNLYVRDTINDADYSTVSKFRVDEVVEKLENYLEIIK